jgi:hypothetical protein
MTESPEQPDARALHCLEPDLLLLLACPKCGTAAEVPWKRLGAGIRCRSCNCIFKIGRHGQLESAAPIRFTCPRCQFVGVLHSQPNESGIACAACSLPLFPGLGGKFYGAAEIQEIKQAAREAASKPCPTGNKAASAAPLRWPLLVGAIAIAACALGLAIVLGGWLFADKSAGPAARQFTLRCLADSGEQIPDEVIDDDYQRLRFRFWRIMHFASIRDAGRPAGDRVRVEVEVVKVDSQQQTLRVAVKSPFLGQRSHVQCWQWQNGGWRFDAAASLGDSARGESTPDKPAVASPPVSQSSTD